MRPHASIRHAALLALCSTTLAHPLAEKAKAEGYVDFRLDDALVVDGQRVVADRKVRLTGAADLASIPLGWEVKAEGKRDADGRIVATKVEARKNGSEKGEAEIKAASDKAEREWVSKGMMYQPTEDGQVQKIGDILDAGPYVTRARQIMDRLRPDHVPASALRVRVVQTKEWNASAMANGAIWVYTGLMDAMDDDELAIVLGHELAHFTYEHSRRNMSKGSLGRILGAGAEIAGAVIGGTGGAIAQVGGQLGASALLSGYSREFEDQADRVGLRYVHEAGFDVRKGPELWGRFKERYGEEDAISNFFTGDHSRPTERIKAIEQQIRWNYVGTPD